ncbi:Hypothetical predicted protein [Mytilus galloprovincialis]|uniref:Anhydro-N-acetylmuramic acid kinase n=1 Tax=Mytilus galloprovincialis TaxID=29158 RepID=A0A8B6ECL7_MYTGA|nr:Hypothetical predicted protein [Mytilus galloprovincialis]
MVSFYAVGCMSGSSLDGIDLCYAEFTGDIETDKWQYRILKAITVSYDTDWKSKLRSAKELMGEDLIKLHLEYGHFIGKTVKDFVEHEDIKNLDCVASHGHTIFHQPNLGYTFQLGEGETSAYYLKQPFVCNFRNKDVALGGQGAPLVPNGEKFLFSDNEICINLGGIANIGLKGLQGYDICPCNYVSNKLAAIHDPKLEYDPNGIISKTGTVIKEILGKLDALHFYEQLPPKSLDAEWIEAQVLPILDTTQNSIPDLLMTYTEHVTNRITEACKLARDSLHAENKLKPENVLKVLVTGGGAFNKHLIRLLKGKLQDQGFILEQVDEVTIAFKEALIFAFLGLRCLLNQTNVFHSVTGSKADSVSGSIHRPAHFVNSDSRIIRYLLEKNKDRQTSCT